MEVEQTTVLDLLGEVAGRRALDAGCGSGRYLRLLADRGAQASGVDRSEAMLIEARRITLPVARGDLRALPVVAASVQLAVCALALGDLVELSQALCELARVLQPGGRVVTSVVHPRGAGAGWSRSFRTESGCWAVATVWHTGDDHARACATAGLRLERIVEPAIVGPDDGPALLVVSATRPG